MKIVSAGAVSPQPSRATREREQYVRFFPKRHAQLDATLSPALAWAYTRLLVHYVGQHGVVAADDKVLALITKLRMPQWLELRDALLVNGYAAIVDGHWVDDDQDESIRRQLENSAAQSARIRKRYTKE